MRQGQNDSPTAFAVFRNWPAVELKQLNIGITIGHSKVSILLFADDIVLITEKENELQTLLDKLHTWCRKWRMKINKDKTKIVHFRPSSKAATKQVFTIGENVIEQIDQYRYLGCSLSEHLNYKIIGNYLSEGVGRALGKLISKFHQNKGHGYKTFTKLYDCCVTPIMDYSSAVWGYKYNKSLDRLHHRAMRTFLCVNRSATIVGLEGEMGWKTPIVCHKINILRFWNRLMKMNNKRLPKMIYMEMKQSSHDWFEDIKSLFLSINAADVLERNVPIINDKQFYRYAEGKLMADYSPQWSTLIQQKPKLYYYKQIKNEYKAKNYCYINLKKFQRSLLAMYL